MNFNAVYVYWPKVDFFEVVATSDGKGVFDQISEW